MAESTKQHLAPAAGDECAAVAAAAAQRQRHLLQALAALRGLLEAAPRLLGVLSTRPAIEPLLACLDPAAQAGHGGQLWSPALPPTARAAADSLQAAQVEQAELALEVLLRLAAHAGCVEAMAHERCLLGALWLAHRPPSAPGLLLSLRLLHALSGTSAAAWAAAAQGGALFLLTVLLPVQQADDASRVLADTARAAAATLLSRFMAHSLHGPRVALLLGRVLPPGLVAAVADGPGEAALAALATDSETPERVWTRGMYRAAAEEAEHMAASARAAQAAAAGGAGAGAGHAMDWAPPEGWALAHPLLEGELLLGGVYVRLFLKHPRHPLRYCLGKEGGAVAMAMGALGPRQLAEGRTTAPGCQARQPSHHRRAPTCGRRAGTLRASWRRCWSGMCQRCRR